MKPSRIAVLSTLALLASGALVFACSSGDDDNDGGNPADAKAADSTTQKDGTTTDSPFSNDAAKDSTTTDSSSEDASDASDASDAPTDASLGDAGVATTFMVLRVGGSDDAGADAALGSKLATAIFLEERDISDGTLVRTLDVPVAVNGQNQPATIAGTSTSEGHLTTSTDGHYVMFAGFAAVPGTTNVSTSTVFDGGVLRVIGRVDHNGTIDTTTLVQAFDQSDIRSAVSTDGTSFWATGSTAASDAGDILGGIQYVAFGSTGTTTNITEVPFNTRVAGLFSGQLYTTSASSPFNGASTVGTGLPTTTGQSSTLLTGFAGDSGSPYGFSVLDLDASVAGVDTLYIADDSAQASGGGVQKWVSNGTTWTKIATFTNGTTVGARALAAQLGASGVTILATTTDGNVIKYFDDGSTLAPTGTVIATALANTAYRGIALAPQ